MFGESWTVEYGSAIKLAGNLCTLSRELLNIHIRRCMIWYGGCCHSRSFTLTMYVGCQLPRARKYRVIDFGRTKRDMPKPQFFLRALSIALSPRATIDCWASASGFLSLRPWKKVSLVLVRFGLLVCHTTDRPTVDETHAALL